MLLRGWGSGWVQVWLFGVQVGFRLGSGFAFWGSGWVQVGLRLGSGFAFWVQVGFRLGSGLASGWGSGWVQVWLFGVQVGFQVGFRFGFLGFRLGSGWVAFWVQVGFRFGFLGFRLGSGLAFWVQVGFRLQQLFGVQVGFRLGSGFATSWVTGSELQFTDKCRLGSGWAGLAFWGSGWVQDWPGWVQVGQHPRYSVCKNTAFPHPRYRNAACIVYRKTVYNI